jgi:hypothetical protein
MPIVRGPKQDFAVALATQKIQEDTRCHDADALELLDRQKIWIAVTINVALPSAAAATYLSSFASTLAPSTS